MKHAILVFLAFVCCATTAVAQKAFLGIDSAEKLHSTLQTPIPSSQAITAGSPFKIKIGTGDGALFAKVTPKPFAVTIAPSAENANTPIEEFKVSAVSNDTLTLIARAPAIGRNLTARTWSVGSYIGVRFIGEYIKQLQDTLNWLLTNGPGTGTVTSITFQSPLTGGTITGSGTVSLPMATSSQNGYLSSGAFTAFSNKQSTVSVTSPITLAGGTNIGITQATNLNSGYLSAADWNTFDSKFSLPDTTHKTGFVLTNIAGSGIGWSSAGSGTVSSVDVSGGSSGLTFANGPIASTGTIQISGGTLAISYGGTGAGTPAQARVNLLPDTAAKTDKFLKVQHGGGIVWDTVTGSGSGSGTVTSVNGSGGITGLTVTGGAITTSGTLTLGGTLSDTNGGTGQASWTKGDLLYANAANTLSKLGIGSSGKILTVVAGAPSWQTAALGTVTSVDMIVPTGFAVSGNPITSSGTLAVTLTSESANMVLASPDGSSGAPSFRSLVVADIPSLDVSQVISGSFSVARGGTGNNSLTAHGVLLGEGTSAIAVTSVGATNTLLHGNTGADPTYSKVATGDVADSNITAVKIATHAVDLAQQVSGVLPVASGGTGQTTYIDGQLLIGKTTGNTLTKAGLTGTTNRVTVTNGSGTITLSGPQDIASTSSPTFAGINIGAGGIASKGAIAFDSSSIELISVAGSYNPHSLTIAASHGIGTNRGGGGLFLDGGASTGSAQGGAVEIFASAAHGSGSAPNTSQDVAKFWMSDTNVASLDLGRGDDASHFLNVTLSFYNSSNSHATSLVAATPTANRTITFPNATGTVALNPLTTTGDVVYSSDNSGTSARLGIGSAGQVLTVSGGIPSWAGSSTLTGIQSGTVHGSTTGLTAGLTYYCFPDGNSTAGTSIAIGNEYPATSNRLLQHLHIKANAAAGAGQSTAVTLVINSVPSAVVATISGASATAASDDVDVFNVSADDLIAVQINPSVTSGATGVSWSFEEVAR